LNTYFKKFKNVFYLLIRHGIVSIVSGGSEYSLFLLMFYQCHFNVDLSYFLAFSISVSINYLGHSFYTFKIGLIRGLSLVLYTIQVAITLIIGYILFNVLIYNNIEPFIAKALQLFCTFFFNVLFGNFITFKKRL
jgi:putative flippase GtrA